MTTPESRIPILVSGAQLTQRCAREDKLLDSLDPISMMAEVSRRAIDEVGGHNIVRAIDTVSVVRSVTDLPGLGWSGTPMFRNPPQSLADKIGAKPKRCLQTAMGGNSPQWLVNRTAEEIARGESEVALLAGVEVLASLSAAAKQGIDLGWSKLKEAQIETNPIEIGNERLGFTDYELLHDLANPTNVYPLFENALRYEAHRSPAEHLNWLGEFFSPLSKVASENSYAWFQTFRSPQEIATPSPDNRFIGYPYTKYMNAVIEVDMAAAVCMMSVAKARELGVPPSRWVYLHGCGDAHDIWNVSERMNYFSSPALRVVGEKALQMAQVEVKDLAHIDLYSCFPSAVEIACKELGIAPNDPRGLTVTGGLPYFGGAGNNYVMHSIVEMTEKLRAAPTKFGLCTGNGWFITKHSAGIYSTAPTRGEWRREDPSVYQAQLDAMEHPKVATQPYGSATVETYTVVHSRNGKRKGIVIGRLKDGERFLAHTEDDDAILDLMTREEMIGRRGHVTPGSPTNLFRFDEPA